MTILEIDVRVNVLREIERTSEQIMNYKLELIESTNEKREAIVKAHLAILESKLADLNALK